MASNLFFFMNFKLRGYVSKTYKSELFPEGLTTYTKEDIQNIKAHMQTSEYDFTELEQCMADEKLTLRARENPLLFNEMVYAVRQLKKKRSLKLYRYLFITSRHYMLENHPVNVVDILMKNQEFFIYQIKRIVAYSKFREWITFKSYLEEYKTLINIQSESMKYTETDLYSIYIMELWQSGMLSWMENVEDLKAHKLI